MKKLLAFIVFGQLVTAAFSQTSPDGFCAQHTLLKEKLKNPAFAAQFEKEQAILNAAAANYKPSDRRGLVYKVPVVFHILHHGGAENIAFAQVKDALDNLNRDFRRLNPEADNVHPDFLGMPADVEIEFVLATIAPDGTCFNGVTRTNSEYSLMGNDGYEQVMAIQDGNDVYKGEWPGDQYMNIFVCGSIIDGAAGYTYYPSGDNSMTNGIWILHNYTGTIGTSAANTRGVLSHEAGHWFNLSHVWGDNNSAGVACGDDHVDDTPETRGSQGCNLNENFCGSRANVENYMDYAGCRKMFTPGQAARMRAAIESSIGGRDNLWTPQNLAATGANGNPLLCNANFTSTNSQVCTGKSIDFSDLSFNGVTSWSWSFPGGVPATSNLSNPTVVYNTPGNYPVTLAVSNGTQTLNVTKPSYVKVYNNPSSLPVLEGFENANQLSQLNYWTVFNQENNRTWEITKDAKLGGVNSAWIHNYGEPGKNIDELISGPVNLSGVNATTKVTLTFRFSYRKIYESNDDYLKVFLSNNCGDKWDQRKTMHDGTLSNEIATSEWVPTTSSDWTTVHMTNVISSYWNENFRYKFRFESDGGNNLYLDNINIYQGAPSETLVLAVTEKTTVENLSVYPNPAQDELHIRFNVAEAKAIQIDIVDVFGKQIQQQQIAAASGSNLVFLDTNEIAPGIYFARIVTAEGMKQVSFVKN